ncbi:hypothetical protein PG993_012395 [Apiospora rasikravindrae]|uniref:Uncharacterized protein n=1 Tax=Apiospora rasikravindrae TaxID=990691 RepID=A0ABR1S2C7_9PEZI
MPPIYVRVIGRRGVFRLPNLQEANPVVWGFGTSLAVWYISNGPKSSDAMLKIPEIQRRIDFAARNRVIREQAMQVYRQLPLYKEFASSYLGRLLSPFLPSSWLPRRR